MQPHSLLSAVLLALPLAFGHPTGGSDIEARAVDCQNIDLFTTEHFEDNMCFTPPASTCLFYTSGLSEQAKSFARNNGAAMTTIWGMWAKSYYNNKINDENNPLRCIFKDDGQRNTYFENMSRAMARSCTVFATVMTRKLDNIPEGGIWGRVEFKTLKALKKVDEILAITVHALQSKIIWKKSNLRRGEEEAAAAVPATVATTVKRETCGCDDATAASFDLGGSLPVDW